MNHQISVANQNKIEGRFVFDIFIGNKRYKVSVAETYWQSLTGEKISPEELARRSFEFLLKHEGPGSILTEFELPLIGHYFPEYEESICSLI